MRLLNIDNNESHRICKHICIFTIAQSRIKNAKELAIQRTQRHKTNTQID